MYCGKNFQWTFWKQSFIENIKNLQSEIPSLEGKWIDYNYIENGNNHVRYPYFNGFF